MQEPCLIVIQMKAWIVKGFATRSEAADLWRGNKVGVAASINAIFPQFRLGYILFFFSAVGQKLTNHFTAIMSDLLQPRYTCVASRTSLFNSSNNCFILSRPQMMMMMMMIIVTI